MKSLYTYFQIEDFSEIFATVITIEFKVFLMKNLYTHFQIACSSKFFATFITIESFLSWTAIILCPYNPILCVKFLPHSSHLYFLKSFMDIFHMHCKIFFTIISFCGKFYTQITNLKIHFKIVFMKNKRISNVILVKNSSL